MALNYYHWLKKLLFLIEPERAQHLSLSLLNYVPQQLFGDLPQHPVNVMGLTFPNRVGAAAGIDKNAKYFPGLLKLGFGFIEVGSLTPLPQVGHPKPRVFRMVTENAVINRIGFENEGIDAALPRLQAKPQDLKQIIGVSIACQRGAEGEVANMQYKEAFNKVYPYADYVAVNISCPNVEHAMSLQEEDALTNLLLILNQEQQRLQQVTQRTVPLVVKVSPDLSLEQIKQMCDVFQTASVAGIIVGNTSVDKSSIAHHPLYEKPGGLSGVPIRAKSTAVLAAFNVYLQGAIPLIGLGGIFSLADAKEKIDAGASLIQIYTGLIYQGPRLVRILAEALR